MNGIFICTRCEWCFVCSLSWITYFFVFAIFISTKMANCYKLPYDDMTSSHVGWSTINRSWTLIALREEPKRKLHWSHDLFHSFGRNFLQLVRPLYFWNTLVRSSCPKHENKKFVINEDLYKYDYFPYTIEYRLFRILSTIVIISADADRIFERGIGFGLRHSFPSEVHFIAPILWIINTEVDDDDRSFLF